MVASLRAYHARRGSLRFPPNIRRCCSDACRCCDCSLRLLDLLSGFVTIGYGNEARFGNGYGDGRRIIPFFAFLRPLPLPTSETGLVTAADSSSHP